MYDSLIKFRYIYNDVWTNSSSKRSIYLEVDNIFKGFDIPYFKPSSFVYFLLYCHPAPSLLNHLKEHMSNKALFCLLEEVWNIPEIQTLRSKIKWQRHGWKKKKTNRQIIVHKTQHRKLKTKQRDPHQKLRESQVIRKGTRILLHMWHPSCFSCYYKPGK